MAEVRMTQEGRFNDEHSVYEIRVSIAYHEHGEVISAALVHLVDGIMKDPEKLKRLTEDWLKDYVFKEQ